MSTQAHGSATPVKGPSKNRNKSDKKRRLEESGADNAPSHTKRLKHAEDHEDEAVSKSSRHDKEDIKEKKKKKKKQQDSAEPSSEKEKHLKVEPQSNGSEHNVIPEAPNESQVTEAPESTEKKKKSKKKEKKEKTIATESAANEVEERFDLMDVDQPSPPAEEAPESTEAHDEPVTSAEAPLALADKSLGVDLLGSSDPSSFYSTRISLYLPIPAITLPRYALSSLLSRHLTPLLLTYFPPVKGIVLAFEDPVMSANAGAGLNHPLKPPADDGTIAEDDTAHVKEILAQTSDQQGVAWVWLTVTFLVFNPRRDDQLYGVNNVASEGFVGLVSYNYFQISIGAKRIPSEWKWRGTETSQGRKQRRRTKGKMDEDGRWTQSSPVPAEASQSSVADERSRADLEGETGFYLESGAKVDSVMKFRVVDTDMVAGSHRGEWALQVDGTLLDDDAEKAVREEEKQGWERQHLRQGTPGLEISGALGSSREGSATSGP